jgi:hypothetical protein
MYAKVGKILAALGQVIALRADENGALVTTAGGGKYAEAVKRGNVYFACTQSAITLTTIHATATGFILSNPAGSGRILSLLQVCVSPVSIGAGATSLHLAGNYNPAAAAVVHTTPLTVRNAYLGMASANVGLADSSATLPVAPTLMRVILEANIATGAVGGNGVVVDDIGGGIIIGEGCAVSLSYLTTAITAAASMLWEEIALR